MWDLLELSAEEIVRSEGDLEVSLVGFAKKKKIRFVKYALHSTIDGYH